ncbi:MAG: ATP-grasp domain-containing protein [Acidimicrobiales bacterium]
MFVEEHDAKQLISTGGIAIPQGQDVRTPDGAYGVANEIRGAVMVKAQVPTGKRGKGGGIIKCDTPDDAREAAERLLGSNLGDFTIDRVLVEGCADIAQELYAAITIDPASGGPLLMLSTEGGMDIEEVHATSPDKVQMVKIAIESGLGAGQAMDLAVGTDLDPQLHVPLAGMLLTLYGLFRQYDAELLEINPLAVTQSGELVALDCKLVIDDNAVFRQPGAGPERHIGTALELEAKEQDFLFVELDGDVGVLANGAGLTMSTMDAVTAHGGSPANFLEVGGMAYKRATPALALVLKNPNVKSLLVNLCGAYARTDVIAEGLIAGFHELKPELDVSFCIHGTGEDRAQQLVRDELGIEPHESMDDAVREAIANAAAYTGSRL